MASPENSEELIGKWKREQVELKQKLITADDADWCADANGDDDDDDKLEYIGGVDISFPKGDDVHACACLVVLSYPELEVVYEDLSMVHLTSPYVPEFLAFREVEFLVDCINKLKQTKPEVTPQVIMVDGNGILHPRGFGIASHLGVLTYIPTVGVAKNLFHVDGIEKGPEHTKQISTLLKEKGDRFPLVGDSGTTWGMALRSSKQTSPAPVCKPIYISIGHRVGLDTAVKIVDACCLYRIPEPTRQADIRSREFLREHYVQELNKCTCDASRKIIEQLESDKSSKGQSEDVVTEDIDNETEIGRKQIENMKLS